jgi:hypothetical protein
VQNQAGAKLRLENQSLQNQIAGLKSDENSLSNQLADASDSKKLSADEFNELLRLRGEVGLLRQKTNQIGQLEDQNQQLQSQATETQAERIAAQKVMFLNHQLDIINMTKQMLLAERIYTGDHPDQYATNVDQLISGGLITSTNFNGGVSTGDIEFMNGGSVNDGMANVITMRERVPRQSPDGQWLRVYGFADGHVEVQNSSDANYDTFEQQHMPSPQNQ